MSESWQYFLNFPHKIGHAARRSTRVSIFKIIKDSFVASMSFSDIPIEEEKWWVQEMIKIDDKHVRGGWYAKTNFTTYADR